MHNEPASRGPLNTGTLSDAGATSYPDAANLNLDPNYQLPPNLTKYKPNKRDRNIRRQVYIRYYQMRDNDWRTLAERDWQHADREYRMYVPGFDLGPASSDTDWLSHANDQKIPAEDDTRSKIRLPDSFAAIQNHMQESLERRSRPLLKGNHQNESNEPREEFCNAVINHNLDETGFDYQWYMAGLAAAIRGTAFIYDYYRVDTRWIKDIDDVDEEGNIKYKEKLVTDIDDDYAKWIPNEYCYIDEKCNHIDDAVDGIRREILNVREFQRVYGQKKDFQNVEFVQRGGDVSTRSYFILPRDISGNDVEILHYYNRALDVYWVAANNVVIRDGPIPWKHKEIPFAVRYYYRVPGFFWGIGIPKVLQMLSEERNSIRNLNMDRQNLQINKMFLHNNMFDLSEDDLVSRPHGLISVDTNGLPLDQAIKPIEYGDVPASYFKTEQIMMEDIIRATGIDTRLTDVPEQNTATSANISREQQLKRVTMLGMLDEIDTGTLIRLGRLKWSNIQFFYPLGRMDTIYEGNKEKQQQVFKTIKVDGRQFSIVKENGNNVLKMDDITGASAFSLDKKMAKYMEGDFTISVNASPYAPPSRAIKQSQVTELFSLIGGNPQYLATITPAKAVQRVLQLNDEDPQDWLSGQSPDPQHTMLAADTENKVMFAGQPLGPTPGATTEHTLMHVMFTQSKEYQDYVNNPENEPRATQIRQLFANHIMGEHESNPAVGSAQQAMNQAGMQATPPGAVGQVPSLPNVGLAPQTGNLVRPQRTGV